MILLVEIVKLENVLLFIFESKWAIYLSWWLLLRQRSPSTLSSWLVSLGINSGFFLIFLYLPFVESETIDPYLQYCK